MNTATTNNTLLHLSLILDVGPLATQFLLAKFPNLSDIYDLRTHDFMQLGLPPSKSAKLVAGLADRTELDRELALIEKHTISWMTLIDPDYPVQLKEIYSPPPILYWQGVPLSDADKRLAIIGSREASNYGQRVIDAVVPPLIKNNWVIVSGGALGADAMAHQATVNSGGKTVVVLGSGLLRWYPKRNMPLFEQVLATGGTVLSIFPLYEDGRKENFPARNRIISGLSRGCVVVQAASKSGTSITAQFALEQGRDVFAVPGPVDDELSAGCHALIKQGAKLITSAADILQEYGEEIEPVAVAPAKAPQQTDAEQQIAIPDGIRGSIIRACATSCSIDDLIAITGLSLLDLQMELFTLQLDGLISQNFAGQWERVASPQS